VKRRASKGGHWTATSNVFAETRAARGQPALTRSGAEKIRVSSARISIASKSSNIVELGIARLPLDGYVT
jgi:hypothetical protein